jgi:hypothetical protein
MGGKEEDAPIADPRLPYDAGKALCFSAAGPVIGRRWRLPGMQTRDLQLLKRSRQQLWRRHRWYLVNVG